MILPRDYNVYQKKVKKFFWSRVYQGTEINLQTLNQLKPEQQNNMSIAKENKSIIYAMGFPIQKLRIILNILKLTHFEENFVVVDLRKIMLNAILRQSLPLKESCGLILKMCYFKLQEPLGKGESFSLNSNKRRKNYLIDDVSLLTNPSQYFREKYQD